MIFPKTGEIFWKFVLDLTIQMQKKDAFKKVSRIW